MAALCTAMPNSAPIDAWVAAPPTPKYPLSHLRLSS